MTKEGKEIIPQIIEKEKGFDKELAQFLENNIEFEQMMSVLKFFHCFFFNTPKNISKSCTIIHFVLLSCILHTNDVCFKRIPKGNK